MRFGSWKLRRPIVAEDGTVKNKAAFVVRPILNVQRKWADWMQRQMEKLSGKGKLLVLIFFCAITIPASMTLLYKGIFGKGRTSFNISRIEIPFLPKPGKPGMVDKRTIERINRFRYYMDSLARDQNGNKTYDSILLAHPGLMDSVSTIEGLYMQQLKN